MSMDISALRDEFSQFVEHSQAQLQAVGVPTALWANLYYKLKTGAFDAGAVFGFGPSEDSLKEHGLYATQDMAANSDLIILDHLWTTSYSKAFKQLMQNEQLRATCCRLMKIDMGVEEEQEQSEQTAEEQPAESEESTTKAPAQLEVSLDETLPSGKYLDLKQNGLSFLPSEIVQLFAQHSDIVVVNLRDNKIADLKQLASQLGEHTKTIKALYLQNNPVMKSTTEEQFLEVFPSLEILNGSFTQNYSEWALMYLNDCTSLEQITYLNLSNRKLAIWKPEVFSKCVNCLQLNATKNSFEVQNTLLSFLESVSNMPKLRTLTVDYKHQGTFHEISEAFPQVTKINDWPAHAKGPSKDEAVANAIFNKMWKYVESYVTSNSYEPVFYLMDEVGLSIAHSDTPNVKIVPFRFSETQETFTLLWPIKDIKQGDMIQRDYLMGVADKKKREILKLIWSPLDVPQIDLSPMIVTGFSLSRLPAASTCKEPFVMDPAKTEYKVYTDSQSVYTGVSAPMSPNSTIKYTLVSHPDEADILWIAHEHFKSYHTLKANQLVNQLPYEATVTMKLHMAELLDNEAFPWYLKSHNLSNTPSLNNFVIEYLNRELSGYDNLWIAKPFNLARSIDINISDNLSLLLKQAQMSSKLASKYITSPCLFQKKKFDLRFYGIVAQAQPLSLYIHNNFRIRVANHEYSLDHFEDFEKHFTVMNYFEEASAELQKVKDTEFIKIFEQEQEASFTLVLTRIHASIRDLFKTASKFLVQDKETASHCKSMYGIDVMLDDKLNPYVLECNFSPDTSNIIHEKPGFFHDVFGAAFFDQAGEHTTKLC